MCGLCRVCSTPCASHSGGAPARELTVTGAADPDTKVWLEAHLDPVFGLPSLVRFSWSTAARLLGERAAPVRWYGTAGTAVGSILPEQAALAGYDFISWR